MSDQRGELHLVVVWESAWRVADRVLDDARRRFVVHDVTRVSWTPERFRANLVRLYGTALPVDSDKERQCGTGAFFVIAVEDRQPRHVARPTASGWMPANAALLAAKRRYRRWAGGGYGVHTTLNADEAERDALLILGEATESLLRAAFDGSVRERRRDLLGDPTWASREELELALGATVRSVLLPPATAGGPDRLLTDDAWWAIRIADPTAASRDPELDDPVLELSVAGAGYLLHVVEVGDAEITEADLARLPRPALPTTPTLSDRARALLHRSDSMRRS